ncbi:MAG: lysostaphin resistance A-like protein [Fimbriimonadaceae bacterium]
MPIAWWALWILFGMLIFAQLYDYVERNKDRTPTFSNEEFNFRLIKLLESVQAMLPSPESAGTSASREDLGSGNTIHVLAQNRKDNVYAAVLYAVMRHDRGDEVQPEDLALLTGSEYPELQAFARIYLSKELTPEAYQEIRTAIPDQTLTIDGSPRFPFATKVALGHAAKKAGETPPPLFAQQAVLLAMTGLLFACGIFALGMILWVVYLVQRTSGRWKPIGLPVGAVGPGLADALALRTTQFMLAFVLLGATVPMALRRILDPQVAMALTMITVFLAIVVLSRFPAVGQHLSLRRLGMRSDNLGPNVLWGLAGFCANVPLVMVVTVVTNPLTSNLPTPEHPITNLLREGQPAWVLALIVIQAAVMAPLIEEVMFRGALLPALTQKLGSIAVAILASSLMFAAIHPTGVSAWFALGAIGATAAMLTYQTGSLVPAIIMHAVHNTAIVGVNAVLWSN